MTGNVIQGPSAFHIKRMLGSGGGGGAGTGRGRSVGIPSNPMMGSSAGARAAAPQFDAQGHELEDTYHTLGDVLGLHALNEGVRERRNAQIDQAAAEPSPHQAAMQDALDTYQDAYAQTGNAQAAMHMVLQDPDFAKHFSNPDAFQSLIGIHQLMSSTETGEAPEVKTVGGHEFANINGKWQVLKPDKVDEGGKYFTDKATGTQYFAPKNDPANAKPVTFTDETGQAKPLQTGAAPLQKPYIMDKGDKEIMAAAPEVLKYMDILKDAGKDAQGFIRGPAGQLMSRLFGTNDPAIVWGNSKANLEQAIIDGKVSGSYGKPLQEYLNKLPESWHATNYDTTGLNMMRQRLTAELTSRANFIEARNQGRPIPNRDQLSQSGIFPGSMSTQGWQNPRALLAAGTPEALGQITAGDANFLKQHFNELTPQEQANWEQLKAMRSPASPQPPTTPVPGGQPPPQPMPGDSQGASAPIPGMMPQAPTQVAPPDGVRGPSGQIPTPPGVSQQPNVQMTPQGPVSGPQSNAGGLIPGAQAAEMPGATPAAQAQPQEGMSAQEMQPSGETASATAPLPPLGGAPANAQQQSDLAMAQQAMQGPNADELARQSAAQHLIEQANQLVAPQGQQ